MHATKKLWGTLRIVATLALARTFGEYVHSAWDGKIHYTVYKWRGDKWLIPSGHIEGAA